MLAVITCLAGILLILLVAEFLWQKKILRGEYQRKFVHILSAGFIASWPWLVSFETIQLIGAAMVAVLLLNRRLKKLHYLGNSRHEDYGDVFLAVAVIICALITDNKVFFATAMAELALADGLAALVGNTFGDKWQYKVFHQTKTVMGSMAFWLISLATLATGMMYASSSLTLSDYTLLLIALPPLLTALENSAVMGLDNIVVPGAVVIALQIVSTT